MGELLAPQLLVASLAQASYMQMDCRMQTSWLYSLMFDVAFVVTALCTALTATPVEAPSPAAAPSTTLITPSLCKRCRNNASGQISVCLPYGLHSKMFWPVRAHCASILWHCMTMCRACTLANTMTAAITVVLLEHACPCMAMPWLRASATLSWCDDTHFAQRQHRQRLTGSSVCHSHRGPVPYPCLHLLPSQLHFVPVYAICIDARLYNSCISCTKGNALRKLSCLWCEGELKNRLRCEL